MRKILPLLILSVATMSVQAQDKQEVELRDGKETYEKAGKKESIIASVPYSKFDDVSKAFKKAIRGWGNLDRGDDEYFVDDGELDVMGENTFDAHAKAFKDGEMSYIAIAVDLGGTFMTKKEHPDKFRSMKDKMREIASEIAQEGLENKIDHEEDVLKDHEKALKNLTKDKEDHQDDIEDLKEEIKEHEAAIEKNNTDQENKKEEIENQKKLVKTLEQYLESFD